MTTLALCPSCDGDGLISECRNPGLCQHVNDERRCPECGGSGEVRVPERFDGAGVGFLVVAS